MPGAECGYAESTFTMYPIANLLWPNPNANVPSWPLAPRGAASLLNAQLGHLQ